MKIFLKVDFFTFLGFIPNEFLGSSPLSRNEQALSALLLRSSHLLLVRSSIRHFSAASTSKSEFL